MKSLFKTAMIEGCLAILLLAYAIILFMSTDIISVSGLDVLNNIFNGTSGEYKLYGAIVLSVGIGWTIFYSMLMVFLYFMRTSRRVMFALNVGSYGIALAGVVVGGLLLFLNF